MESDPKIVREKLLEMWKVALNRPGISPEEREKAEKAIQDLEGKATDFRNEEGN